MKNTKIKTSLVAALAAMTLTAVAVPGGYEISGYVSGNGIHGGNTTFTGGGSSSNYAAVNAGDFVEFTVADTNGTDTARLRVTIDSFTGSNNMMLIQTVSSQGLTDTGTFSFATQSGQSATLSFDWYTIGGEAKVDHFNDAYTITSYDIDYLQYVSTPSAGITGSLVSQDTTLTVSDLAGTTKFSSGNYSAMVDDPNAAFSVYSTMGSHQEFTVGKADSNSALFMFEFRDPSVLAIPEPATIGMMALVVGGAVIIRRRFC